MGALCLAADVEARSIGRRLALERDEPIALEDLGVVALLPMEDDAQNPHGDAHMAFNSRGVAAPRDALRECSDGAVERMHDVIGIDPVLSARRYPGGQ